MEAVLIQFDLETLALHPTKAIVPTVGVDIAVLDASSGVVEVVKRENELFRLNITAQQRGGRVFDEDTLRWWFARGDDARQDLLVQAPNKLLDELSILASFMNQYAGAERVFVMCSAPDLDLSNLRDLLSMYHIELHFDFWQYHNQRTIRHMGCDKLPRHEDESHRADYDAKYQNDVIINALQNGSPEVRHCLTNFFFYE